MNLFKRKYRIILNKRTNRYEVEYREWHWTYWAIAYFHDGEDCYSSFLRYEDALRAIETHRNQGPTRVVVYKAS